MTSRPDETAAARRRELGRVIRQGGIFYLSHSGGKDSQAMYAMVSRIVPHEQLVVVHADLGEVEWEGVEEHIRRTIQHELHVVRADKTLFDMVRRRARTRPDVPAWPSGSSRQCTSDLKRGPIYKFIRNDMKRRCARLGVNCLGLRAEESAARERRNLWSVNTPLSKAGRSVYDWLPLHAWTKAEVFERIRLAGQQAFWAYGAGNERLSCVFCIFGCQGDLANGRQHRPALYEKYQALEREVGWTIFAAESLAERTEGRTPVKVRAGESAREARRA